MRIPSSSEVMKNDGGLAGGAQPDFALPGMPEPSIDRS
jgi:hypothetical protein